MVRTEQGRAPANALKVRWARHTRARPCPPSESSPMSSTRSRVHDEAEERYVPRWPMAVGALALLLGVTVGGYTAGAAVNELEAVEEDELEVSSGLLADPPGGPGEDEAEPVPEPLPEGVEPGAPHVLQNVHGDRVM